MVELVDPSNSFNRMGGTGTVVREYFCTTCDSIKQSEERLSITELGKTPRIWIHVKFNTKEFFERVEETAFKVSMGKRIRIGKGTLVLTGQDIFLIPWP